MKHMVRVMNMLMYNANDHEWETVILEVKESLKALQAMTGKEYGILNRRVIIKNPNGTCNDAYVNM